jgi:error-prone DNA polymerase
MTRLAELGALASLGLERRAALWAVERAARPSGPLYTGLDTAPEASPLPSPLPPMTPPEALVADYEGTGLSLGPHPMVFHRARLRRLGVARAADLQRMRHGARVRVAGAVVVRQRPGTAKGFVFLSLEDESGLVNVVVPPPLFQRCRLTLGGEPFLWVEGTLEHREGVISVRAGRLHPLRHALPSVPSHDFH